MNWISKVILLKKIDIVMNKDEESDGLAVLNNRTQLHSFVGK